MKSRKIMPKCITRQMAIVEAKKLKDGVDSRFCLIPFEKFNANKNFRSAKYNAYDVLCHLNTTTSAGFLVCKYFASNGCTLNHAVQSFNTGAGGTNTLERHTALHKEYNRFQDSLPRPVASSQRRDVARSAGMAAALDLLPFSFADKHDGMEKFVRCVFEAGQATPVDDRIDIKSLMPCAKTVKVAVHQIADDVRKEFATTVLKDAIKSGGGMTIDGVTLKVQDKHFYDLTLHYFSGEFTEKIGKRAGAKTRITCRTLILAEAGEKQTAADIRTTINNALMSRYGFKLEALLDTFTLVSDCCAVMPKIVGRSVSERVSPMDEKWLGCLCHQLNTVMKLCISKCENDVRLSAITAELKAVKTLVRIFKQGGWNSSPPNGYRLIQEVETRFSTTYYVAQRFLKSGERVFEAVSKHDSAPAHQAAAAITVRRDPMGSIIGFPAIEAIFDACDFIVYMQKEMEAAKYPVIHLVLPFLADVDRELRRITEGGGVDRGNGSNIEAPGDLSRLLCSSMRICLSEKLVLHDIYMAACFLHPFYREFHFVMDMGARARYRTRGENMVRSLIRQRLGTAGQSVAKPPVTSRSTVLRDEENDLSKKRKFSALRHADSHFQTVPATDDKEVDNYLRIDVTKQGLNKQEFMEDHFAAVKFWNARCGMYPHLSQVARRIFATPVSSCSSERVFSAVHNIVTKQRATISTEALEDIVVVRSAMSA